MSSLIIPQSVLQAIESNSEEERHVPAYHCGHCWCPLVFVWWVVVGILFHYSQEDKLQIRINNQCNLKY